YKAIKAKEFFMQFYNANCDKIAIENPMPLKIIGLPQETQRIQPYQFGEPWSKKTYLWLKGLQPLEPTDIMDNYKPFVPSKTGRKLGGASYGAKNCAHNSRDRSKTFHGIALAMALQWAGTANELKG
ncbi:MAG: DNA cytosine methyltransferase, partial [Oscillospiraceae bacterium]